MTFCPLKENQSATAAGVCPSLIQENRRPEGLGSRDDGSEKKDEPVRVFHTTLPPDSVCLAALFSITALQT